MQKLNQTQTSEIVDLISSLHAHFKLIENQSVIYIHLGHQINSLHKIGVKLPINFDTNLLTIVQLISYSHKFETYLEAIRNLLQIVKQVRYTLKVQIFSLNKAIREISLLKKFPSRNIDIIRTAVDNEQPLYLHFDIT